MSAQFEREIKWIEFNNDDYYEKEVLAINDRADMIVGYLTKNGYCENDNEILPRVTHYIPCEDLIKLKHTQ